MFKILRRYGKSDSASVAVIFALALLGLIVAAGSAIDFARHNEWQQKIQAAADSAALAAASVDGTVAERKAAIEKFFAANFVHDDQVAEPDVKIKIANGDITVTATSRMKTSFMGIAGIKSMPLEAESGATSGNVQVEISLVLDVSGSMRHSLSSGTPRIDVLKKAAKQLVDVVTEGGTKTSQVKIGIVPFNMNVNIGTDNAKYVQGTANPLFAGQDWAGCVMERANTGANSNDYDGGAGETGKWFAYAWPPEPNGGDAWSCLNKSNGTNSGYAVIDPPSGYQVSRRGPNFNCVRHPLMPLTNKYTDINAKIDQLTAEWNQGTIIGPGVSWGMRLLTPEEPFKEGKSFASNVKKFLIVLTDGEQTTEAEYNTQGNCSAAANTTEAYKFDPSSQGLAGLNLNTQGPMDTYSAYGYIRDSDPFGSNPTSWSDVSDDLYNVSLDACTKAKSIDANGIEVFSIAVSGAAGEGTKVADLLKNCASTPDNFYIATKDDDLIGAFNKIASKITQVRLTH